MTGLGAGRGWIWMAVWDVLSCPEGEKCISRIGAFALLPASGAYTAYAARALHPLGSATVVPLLLDLRVLRRAGNDCK